MGNTIPISYHGSVLAMVDPTQVQAVEPFENVRIIEVGTNVFSRIARQIRRIWNPNEIETVHVEKESSTVIVFKDGSRIKVKMPFLEFIAAYHG